jgi:uncharacterized membrane protein YedE/YeeE
MTTSAVLSGLVYGAAFGFILQRGRFCLNTAFRDIIYIKNDTVFRSYLLAVLIVAVCGNLLEQFGLLRLDSARQEFAWLGNIIGGLLFGAGMVLAGGCASGTWYRVGEGLVGSWLAVLGFMAGLAAAGGGALSTVTETLRRVVIAPGAGLTLDGALGVNRWIILAVLVAAGVSVLLRGRTSYSPALADLRWHTTGAIIGVLVILGWLLSLRVAGEAWGLTFTAPSKGLLLSLVSGTSWDWGVAVVAGVPVGSYLSVRGRGQFSWRAPRADVMVQQFGGGVIMGIGGTLAGGCLIGHGITGLAALSVASLASTASMVLGCWAMVYLLFMKSASPS